MMNIITVHDRSSVTRPDFISDLEMWFVVQALSLLKYKEIDFISLCDFLDDSGQADEFYKKFNRVIIARHQSDIICMHAKLRELILSWKKKRNVYFSDPLEQASYPLLMEISRSRYFDPLSAYSYKKIPCKIMSIPGVYIDTNDLEKIEGIIITSCRGIRERYCVIEIEITFTRERKKYRANLPLITFCKKHHPVSFESIHRKNSSMIIEEILPVRQAKPLQAPAAPTASTMYNNPTDHLGPNRRGILNPPSHDVPW